MKGLIIAASVVVILIVAAIALVLVNADDTATASQTATTQPEAESGESEPSPSLPEFMEERLQDLVERGFITEEQLDEMNEWFPEHRRWHGELPEDFDHEEFRERFREHPQWHGELPEDFDHEEFRERFPEHPRWHGELPEDFDHDLFMLPRFGPHGFGFFHGHADLMDLLDVTPEELMDALAEGTPLVDLIDDPDAFLDSLLAPMEERLDHAVEEGELTQSEADELAAEARSRAEAFINSETPAGGWFMGRRSPHGFGGFGESGPRRGTGTEAEPAVSSA